MQVFLFRPKSQKFRFCQSVVKGKRRWLHSRKSWRHAERDLIPCCNASSPVRRDISIGIGSDRERADMSCYSCQHPMKQLPQLGGPLAWKLSAAMHWSKESSALLTCPPRFTTDHFLFVRGTNATLTKAECVDSCMIYMISRAMVHDYRHRKHNQERKLSARIRRSTCLHALDMSIGGTIARTNICYRPFSQDLPCY